MYVIAQNCVHRGILFSVSEGRCMFLTDPVANGSVKDKRLDPTPVDQLLAVSGSVLEINLKLLCAA